MENNRQHPFAGLEGAASLTAAAHDLKAPLATVHYLASSLQDPELTLTEAERREYLWRIQSSARQGLQLIEGLTYTYNTAQIELALEPVNVTHVCEDVLHHMQPLSRRMAQTLDLRVPRSNVLALANHLVLRSILTNLCDNALKHNPPESHVSVKISHTGSRVAIAVKDSGPQMSNKDFMELKYRLGKQVHPLGGRIGNSGLGLYVSSQLAKAMHGDISLIRHHKAGLTLQLQLQTSHQMSFL